MNTANIESRVKAMPFDEFVNDLLNLSESLKEITEMLLETAEKQRKNAYDELHKKLECDWYKDTKILSLPEEEFKCYSLNSRNYLLQHLQKKHNKLRYYALIKLSDEMQEYLIKGSFEVKTILFENWKIRHNEMLKRRNYLDEESYSNLSELIDKLRIDCQRIFWIYQDKGVSEFNVFLKNREIEIARCGV